MDPAEFRRRNLIADDAYPYTSPVGLKFERLSHQRALAKLLEPLFQQIADTMVDAFTRRADEIHARDPR